MSRTILIIDDSSTMRKIVSRSLRQAGIEAETLLEAGNGIEALEALAANKVDLILSDINMPEMDGLEFLRRKAADPAMAKIPVVMITTEAGTELVVEAKKLGAAGSIKKPFSPEQIEEIVSPLL